METPQYDTLTGLFFAHLLRGGEITSFTWIEMTGFQFANQRFHDLKELGLPVKSVLHSVPWNRQQIAFYSLDKDFVQSFERKDDYIHAAERHWQMTIKKGVDPKATPHRVGQTTEVSNDNLR